VPQIVTLPTGVAEFDVADDGTLVYLVGSATSAAPRNLVWVDRREPSATMRDTAGR